MKFEMQHRQREEEKGLMLWFTRLGNKTHTTKVFVNGIVCPLTRWVLYVKQQWELLWEQRWSLMWQKVGQALLLRDPAHSLVRQTTVRLCKCISCGPDRPWFRLSLQKSNWLYLYLCLCHHCHTHVQNWIYCRADRLVGWVCCKLVNELRWGDHLITSIWDYCISITCAAPFGSQTPHDMSRVIWEVSDSDRNQTQSTRWPRPAPRDEKEMCSHLSTYTSVIQNVFSTCITWNGNAIPCRSILICREGMALSEYGAFIPWTYFLQDVRLCNPAQLRAWLPLEEADGFSAVS